MEVQEKVGAAVRIWLRRWLSMKGRTHPLSVFPLCKNRKKTFGGLFSSLLRGVRKHQVSRNVVAQRPYHGRIATFYEPSSCIRFGFPMSCVHRGFLEKPSLALLSLLLFLWLSAIITPGISPDSFESVRRTRVIKTILSGIGGGGGKVSSL